MMTWASMNRPTTTRPSPRTMPAPRVLPRKRSAAIDGQGQDGDLDEIAGPQGFVQLGQTIRQRSISLPCLGGDFPQSQVPVHQQHIARGGDVMNAKNLHRSLAQGMADASQGPGQALGNRPSQ